MSTRKSTSVSCSPSDCSLCTPEVVMQVSPSLAAGQLRLTLGGEASQGNLVSTIPGPGQYAQPACAGSQGRLP